MNVFGYLSILLLALGIQTGQNMAIKIEIRPSTYDHIKHDNVNITCTPNGNDVEVKTILFLRIMKENKPIVVQRSGAPISFPYGKLAKYEANGHIEADPKQSYLSLILKSVDSSDYGQYSCGMYFLNDIGQVKMEKSIGQLKEEELNITILKQELAFMKAKFLKVESESKKEAASMLSKLNGIARQMDSQNKELDFLKRKANRSTERTNEVKYISAFKATIVNTKIIRSKQSIVFDDVMWSQGIGYNKTTGIYTAPRNGIYFFEARLYLVFKETGGHLLLVIAKNEKAVAETMNKINGKHHQSSCSTVANLRRGDKVRIVVKTWGHGPSFNAYHFLTMFSGSLLQLHDGNDDDDYYNDVVGDFYFYDLFSDFDDDEDDEDDDDL